MVHIPWSYRIPNTMSYSIFSLLHYCLVCMALQDRGEAREFVCSHAINNFFVLLFLVEAGMRTTNLESNRIPSTSEEGMHFFGASYTASTSGGTTTGTTTLTTFDAPPRHSPSRSVWQLIRTIFPGEYKGKERRRSND